MKFLIINSDDFGYGRGVNRAVAELAERGVVTSASLMVNTAGTAEAVRLAAGHPQLSLGLHVNFTNEGERLVEFADPRICRRELRRQLQCFLELTGELPTHLDSHHHVHRLPACAPSFAELAAEYGLPLRGRPPVTYKGGFYAQWEYGVSQPENVSFAALEGIISTELGQGVYELAVHPGRHDPAVRYAYRREREWELAALADPRLPPLLRERGVRLISYRQLASALVGLNSMSGA
jgi:predicted glycoside hydrolase/deacetylase ChbG (UPF0249 family)